MPESTMDITTLFFNATVGSGTDATISTCIDCFNTTIQAQLQSKLKGSETSYMTPEEYSHYSKIFTWIKVIGQPISASFLILSAMVFMRRGMRNSSTGFLVTLNIAEAYNVILLSVYQICKLSDSCFDVEAYAFFLLWATTYVGMACRRSVYLFNCLVAVQRFMVVAFPMRSKDWRILHRPKSISAIVLLLMLIANSYIPVKYMMKRVGPLYKTKLSDIAEDHPEIFTTITTIVICLTSYLPVMLGIFANIGMGTALWLHSKAMGQMNHGSGSKNYLKRGKKHSQTTFIVLASTLLFFVFALPSTLNHIVMETRADYGSKQKERYLYFTLSEGFVTSQIASDMVVFFSYIFLGSSFREHLRDIILGPCRKNTQERNNHTSVYSVGPQNSIQRKEDCQDGEQQF